ncbi:MAG TPA: thiamine-phosphate kinase [Geminicoccaceae bacterium]|jgi:thiamine-monophosphate kinase|nr:thiamine-phosphate kinase [Geminicoccaceae bacterium]
MPEGEFEFIARRLRPLATAHGALALTDDAALLDPSPGRQLVLAKDAMVAGVHFLPADPPGQIAQKLLRVNLSDLAAMGAAPLGYLLALARPKEITDGWLAEFCAGLAADNAAFEIALLGGDTVSTPGPLTLSLTAIGEVPRGAALLRGGARAGDDVWVSGTLGDAALGLEALQGKLAVAEPARAFLIERYRLPQPRLALGEALRGIASAAIDVSDGLVADLGHVLDVSGVGAELRADALPLSAAARDLPGARDAALAGGDDYELLFTAAPEREAGIAALARQLAIPLARIGAIRVGSDLRIFDASGRAIVPPSKGWQHF